MTTALVLRKFVTVANSPSCYVIIYFFKAIRHQKHKRVKLNNKMLTNENEETNTEFHTIILRLVSY